MVKTIKKAVKGFSDEERAAMKARAKELLGEARLNKNKALGENEVLVAIAKMPEPDRSLAQKLHVLIKKTAPILFPKTWYGMPAYGDKDGKVVCFFKCASKFKTRYATLGFSDSAKLDEGAMWPTDFAIKKLTPEVEAQVTGLVKKAVSS